jgi:hypothetical protein
MRLTRNTMSRSSVNENDDFCVASAPVEQTPVGMAVVFDNVPKSAAQAGFLFARSTVLR